MPPFLGNVYKRWSNPHISLIVPVLGQYSVASEYGVPAMAVTTVMVVFSVIELSDGSVQSDGSFLVMPGRVLSDGGVSSDGSDGGVYIQ